MIPNWPSLVDQAMRFLQGPGPRNPEAVLPSAVAMNSTPNFASDEAILTMGAFFNVALIFLFLTSSNLMQFLTSEVACILDCTD